ncbi:MAG TPA: DUF2520 domain-containing protein [Solirubrobacteraceae bacterium]|nr:DUF2520 domain-containing protein [Solirubrobacteraceae bacterium]
MRELDQALVGHPRVAIDAVAIVGHGRLGTAIASALTHVGIAVDGPYQRRDPVIAAAARVDAVLLCVPDAEIAAVAAAIAPGAPVGHCSGATGLDALGAHAGFSLHPLMTVPADARRGALAGAGAAVAASTPRAAAVAWTLAELLRMRPIEIADDDRAAYHAAASIASNFLVTLEGAAERVAATAGLPRELLAPLVRATVDNWARLGAEQALTGPVARGDAETVRRQRAAVQARVPELLELFDALAAATERLAAPGRDEAVAA